MSDLLSNYKIIEEDIVATKANEGLVDNCLRLVGNLLFPLHCGNCNAPGTLLCEDCEAKLEFDHINRCLVCGGPSGLGHTHANCLTTFTPQKFLTVFSYRPPFSKILQRVKYKQRAFSYLEPLVKIAMRDLRERGVNFGQEAVVVPTPLHFLKQLQRGFNVSEIIAQKLATEFDLFYQPKWLQRIRNTKTQTKLNKEERRQNVGRSFRVPKNYHKDLAERDILLVDDVCTTGATLLAATHALKEAGAGQVWCFSLARD